MIFLDKEYDTVTTASPQNPLGNHFLQGYYHAITKAAKSHAFKMWQNILF